MPAIIIQRSTAHEDVWFMFEGSRMLCGCCATRPNGCERCRLRHAAQLPCHKTIEILVRESCDRYHEDDILQILNQRFERLISDEECLLLLLDVLSADSSQ